jgi:hypothetical protein
MRTRSAWPEAAGIGMKPILMAFFADLGRNAIPATAMTILMDDSASWRGKSIDEIRLR